MSEQNYKILIADDDREFHRQVRYAFRKNYEFEGAETIPDLQEKLQKNVNYDLILLDLIFNNVTKEKIGLEWITKIIASHPSLPIIVATNENDIEIVVEAMNRGAKSFLYKESYDNEKWNKTFQETIRNAKLTQENNQLKQTLTQVKEEYEYINPPNDPLIGSSAQMDHVRRSLKILSGKPDKPVLITGETGVGKGVAARFLHYNSLSRKKQPFEDIYISNIPKSLMESTLFGAKKGTFTGAVQDIKGRLHLADKGIVFLDEIGDLDSENQIKLLQFLQSKTIRPIGFNQDIKLDVHIIAATNKNLREEVKKGNFREDLYQRLKVFPVEIPPLRERREDILDLLLHFLQLRRKEDLNTLFDAQVQHIFLETYDWVGNIRELENTIESSKHQQEVLGTDKITFECLPEDIRTFQKHQIAFPSTDVPVSTMPTTLPVNNDSHFDLEEQKAWTTLDAIEKALLAKNGAKGDAAILLGYESSDHIRYRVNSIYKNSPHLLKQFPVICRKYKLNKTK